MHLIHCSSKFANVARIFGPTFKTSSSSLQSISHNLTVLSKEAVRNRPLVSNLTMVVTPETCPWNSQMNSIISLRSSMLLTASCWASELSSFPCVREGEATSLTFHSWIFLCDLEAVTNNPLSNTTIDVIGSLELIICDDELSFFVNLVLAPSNTTDVEESFSPFNPLTVSFPNISIVSMISRRPLLNGYRHLLLLVVPPF
mmetsp:Transcript_3216/g.4943  ORF Transcript_3216/g.4943 Transcript_3216/m.4943 type:complete len:201 (+) Transcript_3216:935-1537(+)